MAESGPLIQTLTAKAAADLSLKQYHFVRWSAADTVNTASLGSAQDFAGVLLNQPSAAGRHATVAVTGKVKIVAAGSVTVNDYITTTSNGRAVAAASGDMVAGRALQAATTAGEVISMQLMPFFNGNIS